MTRTFRLSVMAAALGCTMATPLFAQDAAELAARLPAGFRVTGDLCLQ